MSEAKEKRPKDREGTCKDAGEEKTPFKVDDRRHWARRDSEEEPEGSDDETSTSTHPTLLDEFRLRAEAAEKKLLEYIAAFKEAQAEQESHRARLDRDVKRKVELRFGELISDLLETADDLELALSHSRDVPQAEPLVKGVALARDRFLANLERHGVERIEADGHEFDPNLAEAVRMEPVEDPELNGKIVKTLRPGYKLGERVLRVARVAVGRSGPASGRP